MFDIVQLARHYYEKSYRKTYVGDEPEWISDYQPVKVIKNKERIKKLHAVQEEYDEISYSLYGTGEDLERSVSIILEYLGLEVEKQPPGANIDFKAKSKKKGYGFAIEITGTKGNIKKDSKKISQVFTYLTQRVGSEEESHRMVVIANTQCHLDPKDRDLDCFSREVVDLMTKNEVLLLTTVQLYELWKSVFEKREKAGNIVDLIYNSTGVFNRT